MNVTEPTVLSESLFFDELVPSFDKIKAELYLLLGRKRAWKNFLSKLHIVYIDNSKFGQSSYLGISNSVERSVFLTNSKAKDVLSYSAYTPGVLTGFVAIALLDHLKRVFLEELLLRATPQQVCEYLFYILQNNYRNVTSHSSDQFLYIRYLNMHFSHDIFTIARSDTFLVLPLKDDLDANEIVFEDQGEDDVKVLIANRRDVSDYKNFHRVLDVSHLVDHFSRFFTSGISLYQNVLRRGYSDIFKIVDLLQMSSDYGIYEIKEELVNLSLSHGHVFQDYLENFLTLCFKPYFQEFGFDIQKPNEDGTRIRDFIITNNSSSSDFLKYLKRKGTDLLLFDAKNYSEVLTTRDLDTFRAYLVENRYFGKFGIILSRKGASEACLRHITTYLRDTRLKIVVLDEEDLLLMLDYVDFGRNPIDVIESKYTELLKRL